MLGLLNMRTLISRSSAVLRVGCVCLAAGLDGLLMPAPVLAQTQTLACPLGTSATHEHWHSAVSNNLADKAPEQCASCADPVNYSHDSCSVYRLLQSADCRDGACGNEQGEYRLNWQERYAIQQSLRYQQPLKFILDAGSNCWFLVWALDPVIGVEHAGARDAVNFWRAGFEAATTMVQPPIPQNELAMMIQPAHRRSQHQLHIHVGRLQSAYRQAIDQLPLEPTAVHVLALDGHEFYIRYLPDLSSQSALAGYQVLEQAAAVIPGGEAAVPRYGVLLARTSDGAGSWLMAAEGLTRRELLVWQDRACGFR